MGRGAKLVHSSDAADVYRRRNGKHVTVMRHPIRDRLRYWWSVVSDMVNRPHGY